MRRRREAEPHRERHHRRHHTSLCHVPLLLLRMGQPPIAINRPVVKKISAAENAEATRTGRVRDKKKGPPDREVRGPWFELS